MKVETFPLGPLETNSYLAVSCKEAVAVDAGGNPSPMVEYLNRNGLTLGGILITHMHCDHIYGVAALSLATGAPVLAGADDAYLMETELGRGGFMGLPMVRVFDWTPIREGEMTLMGQPCKVLATPGHTLGSLSYYFPQGGAVFAGDLVFYRSIGRTDFPGGDMDLLLGSVREKIFTLPEDTAIYSGHGPATSVGAEQKHNPYFSEFAR